MSNGPPDAASRSSVPAPVEVPRNPRLARGSHFGMKYGLVGLTAVVIMFFGLHPETRETFMSVANWRGILANQAVLLLLALSFTIPLIGGEFDLSIGGIFGLCGVVFAGLMGTADLPVTGGLHLPIAVAGALVLTLGLLIGLANGALVTRAGVDSLICTLGTGIVAGGLVLWYTDGRSVSEGLPQQLSQFGTGTTFGIPQPAIVVGVVGLLVWHLLEYTPFGRELGAIGSNRRAAQLVGIRVERVLMVSFVLAGVLAALAGMLQVSRQGAGVPTDGLNQVIAAFAATYLGANTIKPGRFNVLGTVVGLLFVASLVNGLSILGVAGWVEPVVYGGSLVIALAFTAYFQRRLVAGRQV